MALTLRTNILSKRLLFLCALFMWTMPIASAHNEDGHKNDLREILFGCPDPILSQKGQENFTMLCEAAYLTLDYFNGRKQGKRYLDDLRNHGVKDLPKDTSEINYRDFYHQRFTHMGWNHDYGIKDSAKWETRKLILINTVQHIGKFKNQERIKIEAFAALVYDLHILGDHIVGKEGSREYRVRLTSEPGYKGQVVSPTSDGPFNNPTLFVYLLYHTQRLFREQSNTSEYKQLENFLNKYKDYFWRKDNVNYSEIQDFAKKTKVALQQYIPGLLKREKFFQRAFYQ